MGVQGGGPPLIPHLGLNRHLHLHPNAHPGELIDVVGDGNRKDIRNAVEAANNAAGGWGKRAAHNRAQICFYIAENLSIRSLEFASRISKMTGASDADAMKEVRLGL